MGCQTLRLRRTGITPRAGEEIEVIGIDRAHGAPVAAREPCDVGGKGIPLASGARSIGHMFEYLIVGRSSGLTIPKLTSALMLPDFFPDTLDLHLARALGLSATAKNLCEKLGALFGGSFELPAKLPFG
jgi:hypothetical protein